MKAVLIRSTDALRGLAPRLAGAPDAPRPFACPEVISAWLGSSAARETPFLFAVFDEADTLAALAPWSLRTSRAGLRTISGVAGKDAWYHDVWYLTPGERAAVNQALADALREHRGEWDVLALQLQVGESHDLLHRLAGLGQVVVKRQRWRQSFVIDFVADYAQFLGGLSSNYRKQLRRAQKKLQEVPHAFTRLEGAAIAEAVAEVCALQAERLREKRDWAPYHAYMKVLHDQALARGEVLAYRLEIGGKTAAMEISIRRGDRLYGTLRSFAPETADYHPGMLLSDWSFADMVAAGIRRIDMGPGENEWKARMHTGQIETVEVQLASSAVGLLALIGAGVAVPWLKEHPTVRGWVEQWRSRQKPRPLPSPSNAVS